MAKKVYLFATCLGSAAMQETVLNAIKLLRRAGVEIVFVKDQTCCSQPSFNTGYFDESRAIAMHNVELFSRYDYPIVVPSGSCAGMMSHDFLDLFKKRPEFEKVANFSKRVFDVGQYLIEQLDFKYEDKGEPVKVTWHTNCHALRVQHSIDANKEMLRRLKNVELVDLPFEEECCGFGGTFAVKEPAISDAMVKEKIKHIQATGCKYVISGDGGCLINIAGTMHRMGLDVKGVHLYDFVWKRIQGEAL